MTRNRPSRIAILLVLGLLAAVVVAPGTAAAAGGMTISGAELAMVDALNVDRTTRGLVPVRVDSRLMAIARARSVDMATKDYFSHTQPDGRNVFDMISAQKITWYNAGEIIAWNNYPTLETSVAAANNQWLNSPGHKAIVVSTTFNYVGVGLALGDNGKKIWTAVYMKGPDRTGARATTATPTITAGATAASKRVTVTWSGADVKLQVLTSGFHSFQVQRRVDGGNWTMVWIGTTRTSMTLDLATNHTYEFRVAARDKAGNWGGWSLAKATLAASTGSVVVRR
jgi:Cysteine-rich secretory protein family